MKLTESKSVLAKTVTASVLSREKMKSVGHYLAKIRNDDTRRRAINNTPQETYDSKIAYTKNIGVILSSCFSFAESPEGWEFWYKFENSKKYSYERYISNRKK